MHFSGCLSNSTRDVSTGFKDDATKAALKAERDSVAQRRQKAAGLDSTDEAKPQVEQAGKVRLDDAAGEIVQTSASTGKPLADKKIGEAAKDPFAEKMASDPVGQLIASNRPLNAAELAKQLDDSTPLSIPEEGAQKTVAARPFPGAEAPAAEGTPTATKTAEVNPFAAQKVSAQPTATAAAGKSKVVGPTPPTEWTGATNATQGQKSLAAAGNANTSGTPSKQATAHADDWTVAPARARLDSTPQADTATPKTQLKPVAMTPAEREKRLRVKALLSEAHTHAMRGELHSAYRSALLAEKILAENKLAPGTTEEDPSALARELAAKIWRTSDSDAMLAASQTSGTAATSASPAARSTGSVFPEWNNLNSWTPIPGSDGAKAVTQAKPESRSALDLPEIRPAQTPTKSEVPSNALPTPSNPFAQRTPDATPSATAKVPTSEPAKAEGGVTFAIAESLTPAGESQPERKSRRPEWNSVTSLPEQAAPPVMASAVQQESRPVLMAPAAATAPEPAILPKSAIAWDQLTAEPEEGRWVSTEPRKETAKSAKNQARLFWGLGGLLAAGASLAFGLRLLRRNTEAEVPPAVATTPLAQETEEPAAENLQLRIKRAA
ncbi:hypothetical protein [Planctomicrobium sp. SH664]|uniref:hypothetical protein n=1 Tax=Planctomicrobium sp. SH664 TaxID=3448125 RepID=UPI003F5BFC2B